MCFSWKFKDYLLKISHLARTYNKKFKNAYYALYFSLILITSQLIILRFSRLLAYSLIHFIHILTIKYMCSWISSQHRYEISRVATFTIENIFISLVTSEEKILHWLERFFFCHLWKYLLRFSHYIEVTIFSMAYIF